MLLQNRLGPQSSSELHPHFVVPSLSTHTLLLKSPEQFLQVDPQWSLVLQNAHAEPLQYQPLAQSSSLTQPHVAPPMQRLFITSTAQFLHVVPQ